MTKKGLDGFNVDSGAEPGSGDRVTQEMAPHRIAQEFGGPFSCDEIELVLGEAAERRSGLPDDVVCGEKLEAGNIFH